MLSNVTVPSGSLKDKKPWSLAANFQQKSTKMECYLKNLLLNISGQSVGDRFFRLPKSTTVSVGESSKVSLKGT